MFQEAKDVSARGRQGPAGCQSGGAGSLTAPVTARVTTRPGALLILLAAALVCPVSAQTPTPDQLRMLQGMSAEQRQMLMQQLGLGNGTGEQADQRLQSPVLDRPKAQAEGEASDRSDFPNYRGPQRIRGADTVLLDVAS